ncbi:uncharacterized protein LOC130906330 isoform X4 [Corythoichthys intestinalis]|uniref:uncharacterized protein LOC130906330 isoform X4 n=1 Tax=Corythoichthys intestinalis TaxID=161448 RepID=UPI0025A62345|nr:uncharacterized protein LOC130906330 isoform X4 [Corythoichthys intestinalis]
MSESGVIMGKRMSMWHDLCFLSEERGGAVSSLVKVNTTKELNAFGEMSLVLSPADSMIYYISSRRRSILICPAIFTSLPAITPSFPLSNATLIFSEMAGMTTPYERRGTSPPISCGSWGSNITPRNVMRICRSH